MNLYDNFQSDLRDIFSKELNSYKQSQEIYRSLCNTVWEKDGHRASYSWRAAGALLAEIRNSLQLKVGDPDVCETCGKAKDDHILEKHTIAPFWSKEEITLTALLCSRDGDDRFIPGYSGSEDYMDFYCSGGEGDVPGWVKDKMKEAGYHLAQ